MRKLSCEVLIVGSGAGGSTAFKELATKYDVLMIEEGSKSLTDLNHLSIAKAISISYRDSGVRPVIGLPGLTIGEGKMIGGSTEINGGLFWRAPDYVFRKWRNDDSIKSILDEVLDVYSDLEKELGAGAISNRLGFDLDSTLLNVAAQSKGFKIEEAIRVSANCKRHNRCPVGCTSGAKKTMSQTFIPEGISKGGRLLSGCKAISISEYRNGLVTLCEINSELVEIFSRKLIVSCGAIESPRLLNRSNYLKTRNWSIGFHSNLKIIAEFPEEMNSSKGTIFTHQLQEYMNEGFILMAANFNTEYLAASSQALDNPSFKEILSNIEKMAMYTVQVETSSRIKDYLPRSSKLSLGVHFDRENMNKIIHSLQKSAEILFHAGAVKLYLPILGKAACSIEEVKSLLEDSPFRNYAISTVHIMASLPINAKDSNVKKFGNFSHKNIYVLDGSLLPSTLGESPQETIMAFSRVMSRAITL